MPIETQLALIVAALRQFERLCARRLNSRTCADQQLGRAHENADLPRRNALAEGLLDEGCDGARFRCLVLRHDDLGERASQLLNLTTDSGMPLREPASDSLGVANGAFGTGGPVRGDRRQPPKMTRLKRRWATAK